MTKPLYDANQYATDALRAQSLRTSVKGPTITAPVNLPTKGTEFMIEARLGPNAYVLELAL